MSVLYVLVESIKFIYILMLLPILIVSVLLSGSDNISKDLRRRCIDVIRRIPRITLSGSTHAKIDFAIELLTKLAPPFVVATAFLSVPGDVFLWIQDEVRRYFWPLIAVSEVIIILSANSPPVIALRKNLFDINEWRPIFIFIIGALICAVFDIIYLTVAILIDVPLYEIDGFIGVTESVIVIAMLYFLYFNGAGDVASRLWQSVTAMFCGFGGAIFAYQYICLFLGWSGNATAETEVGRFYEIQSRESGLDLKYAIEAYQRAADKGDKRAEYKIGEFYENGDIEPLAKREDNAVLFYKKSAEQNYYLGQLAIGLAYDVGLGGLSEDYREAKTWYKKAADQGYALAKYALCVGGRAGKSSDELRQAAQRCNVADIREIFTVEENQQLSRFCDVYECN